MHLTLGLCLLLGTPAQAPGDLNGTWEITAAIDDGEVIPPAMIKQRLVRDGRLTIAGQEITFNRPVSGEKRTLLYITNPKANPPTIDLGGGEKVGSKGIYLLSGDSLLLCQSGPGIEIRPTEFASHAGTHALLMTLRRVSVPGAPAAPAAPPVVQGAAPGADVRKMLLGTWGSQDSDKIDYYTFNPDGSFSMVRQWKKTFKKLFDDEDRWSGTWNLDNSVVVLKITAATEKAQSGQIYSYRLNSISPTDLIFIDQDGQVRRQWKVR